MTCHRNESVRDSSMSDTIVSSVSNPYDDSSRPNNRRHADPSTCCLKRHTVNQIAANGDQRRLLPD